MSVPHFSKENTDQHGRHHFLVAVRTELNVINDTGDTFEAGESKSSQYLKASG